MKYFASSIIAMLLLLVPDRGFAQPASFETQLFEGKLVGVSFDVDAHTKTTQFRLQFLQTRGFAMTAPWTDEIPLLTSLACPANIDPSKLTSDTWQTQIESALPEGVLMGQECLVTVEWKLSEGKLLSIVSATDQSRHEFLRKHLDYLLRYHQHQVQTAVNSYSKNRRAHENNVKQIEVAQEAARKEEKNDDLAMLENQLKTARWDVIQNTGWCQRSLIGQKKALLFLNEQAPQSHDAINELLRKIDEGLAALPPNEVQQSTNSMEPTTQQ